MGTAGLMVYCLQTYSQLLSHLILRMGSGGGRVVLWFYYGETTVYRGPIIGQDQVAKSNSDRT